MHYFWLPVCNFFSVIILSNLFCTFQGYSSMRQQNFNRLGFFTTNWFFLPNLKFINLCHVFSAFSVGKVRLCPRFVRSSPGFLLTGTTYRFQFVVKMWRNPSQVTTTGSNSCTYFFIQIFFYSYSVILDPIELKFGI